MVACLAATRVFLLSLLVCIFYLIPFFFSVFPFSGQAYLTGRWCVVMVLMFTYYLEKTKSGKWD